MFSWDKPWLPSESIHLFDDLLNPIADEVFDPFRNEEEEEQQVGAVLRWFYEVSVVDGQLVDPRTGVSCNSLKVYAKIASDESLPAKTRSARKIRAYACSSQRAYRSVTKVSLQDGEARYMLGLMAPGHKPKDGQPYYFVLQNQGGGVFLLYLVRRGDPEPKKKRPIPVEERAREEELVSLVRAGKQAKTVVEERYGDEVYLHPQLDEEETILVGDVVARVERGYVTCNPRQIAVLGWGIVANHLSTLGFFSELPQPHTVRTPYGQHGKFVMIATRGIVAVRTDGKVRPGEVVVASGRNDGCAVELSESDVVDEKAVLGRVSAATKNFALVEVNFDTKLVILGEGSLLQKENGKLERRLREAEDHMEIGNYEEALSILRKARKFEAVSSHLRSRLCFNIAQIYMQKEEYGVALRKALKASKLHPASVEALVLVARCCLYENQPKKALKAINKALVLAPGHEDALACRSRAFAMEFKSLNRPLLYESMRNKISSLLFCGEEAEERSDGRVVLTGRPLTQYEKYQLQMDSLLIQGAFEQARELLEESDYGHPGILVSYARHLLCNAELLEEVEEILWKAVEYEVCDESLAKTHVAMARGLLCLLWFCQDKQELVVDWACDKDWSCVDDACLVLLGNHCRSCGNDSMALDFYRMAIARANPIRAAGLLGHVGEMILRGQGTIADRGLGLRYLERAVELGASPCSELVSEVKSGVFREEQEAFWATLSRERYEYTVAAARMKENGGPFPQEFHAHLLQPVSAFATELIALLGKYDQAIDLIEAEEGGIDLEVVKLMADVYEGLGSNGNVLRQRYDEKEAIKAACDRILRLNPNSREALVVLCSVSQNVSVLEQALVFYPNDPFFLAALACKKALSENYDYYESLARRAVELAPNNPEILYSLTTVMRFRGGRKSCDKNIEEKVEACLQFLKIAPVDHPQRPSLFYYLAFIDTDHQDEWIRKGELAEKDQLEAFLPHCSLDKQLALARVGRPMVQPFSVGARRTQAVQDFRNEGVVSVFHHNDKPVTKRFLEPQKERASSCWTPLEPPALRHLRLLDFVPLTNKIHTGCVILLKVISRVRCDTPQLRMLVEDVSKDVSLLLVDGFRERTPHFFELGVRFWIADPVQRVARNGSTVVRVAFAPSSFVCNVPEMCMKFEVSKLGFLGRETMCSYCCESIPEGQSVSCCRETVYCSDEHMTADWELGPTDYECSICGESIICKRYHSSILEDFDCCQGCATEALQEKHQFILFEGENH